jgi:plastocyanin
MRRLALLLAGSLALAAVATGCQTDFTDKPARPPVALSGRVNNEGTRDVTASPNLELELRDFAFKPTFVKALPGQRVSIELDNTSGDEHTFTVSGTTPRIDVVVAPHERAHVDVLAPNTGVLTFACRFHEAQGMQGAIYVDPGSPVIGAPGGVDSTTTPYPSGWGS